MLSGRKSQSQKVIYCPVPFTEHSQHDRSIERVSRAQEEERELQCKGGGGTRAFLCNGAVLYFDCDGGSMKLYIR